MLTEATNCNTPSKEESSSSSESSSHAVDRESSSHAATCYLLPVLQYKGRSNPFKCLAQGHNNRICRPFSAER